MVVVCWLQLVKDLMVVVVLCVVEVEKSGIGQFQPSKLKSGLFGLFFIFFWGRDGMKQVGCWALC